MNNAFLEMSQASLAELAKARMAQILAEKQKLSNLDKPVDWIETNFFIPELNGPMILMPYQKAVLNEALSQDEKGNYKYSTIVWADLKKSIKSCIAASVALYKCFSTEWAQVILIANDLKGADSRVGYYMRRAIEMNPQLRSLCKIKNYRSEFPNHSYCESVAIDPSGEAGSNADMIVFSELWGAHEDAKDRMWTEMTLSPTKFGRSFRWVETYAGYTGESVLLERLYTNGVKHGRQVDVGIPGLELFANDAARQLTLWNTQPRCTWQTDEYYAQEAATLDPREFLRVHRNQWVSSVDTFVPMEWWNACRRPLPELKSKQPLVLGIDAAVSNDAFAIVGVSRHKRELAVRYARCWYPPKGGKINYDEPRAEIRRLAKEYNIVEFAYDEFQLHDFCQSLQRDGVGWFRQFGQQGDRAIADKTLYDLIRDRRIYHSGEADLEEHIGNCNAEQKSENKMRLIKKSDSRHIDMAVALSMASAEALRLNLDN
jgi:phage terminase large subunit-like protein